jgi:hypothetical protein
VITSNSVKFELVRYWPTEKWGGGERREMRARGDKRKGKEGRKKKETN